MQLTTVSKRSCGAACAGAAGAVGRPSLAPAWQRRQAGPSAGSPAHASAQASLRQSTAGRQTICAAAAGLAAASAPHIYIAAAAAADGRDLDQPLPGFDSIPDALAAIAAGEPVVVLDDEDRENEGDLIMAADRCSEEAMAFFVRYTSGVVCVGMEGADLDRLHVPLMVSSAENEEAMYTAFTVTVDLRHSTSTGISAADRAATVRALADPKAQPEDFKRPGHIFPLRARPGGVLRRPGHTEAGVDLPRLAGCHPSGVLCEIVNDDGTMARTPQLLAFAQQHGLRVITIADLIRYRLKHEQLVERTAAAPLATRHGTFTAYTYRSLLDGGEHLALVAGPTPAPAPQQHTGSGGTAAAAGGSGSNEGVLTRIQGESMLGDVFGAGASDSARQLDASLAAMAAAGAGVLVYLRGQQGRGLDLEGELRLHAAGEPLFEVDARDYGAAAHILRDLGVASTRLITSNRAKANSLQAHGIAVLECLPSAPAVGADGAQAAGGRAGSSGRGLPPRSRNGAEPHFV